MPDSLRSAMSTPQKRKLFLWFSRIYSETFGRLEPQLDPVSLQANTPQLNADFIISGLQRLVMGESAGAAPALQVEIQPEAGEGRFIQLWWELMGCLRIGSLAIDKVLVELDRLMSEAYQERADLMVQRRNRQSAFTGNVQVRPQQDSLFSTASMN